MRSSGIPSIMVFFTLFMVSCSQNEESNKAGAAVRTDSTAILIAQYPDSVDLLNQSAFSALQSGDTGKSIQYLSHSLGVKLDQPEVENELGFLLAAIKSEQALLVATRMIKSEKALFAAQGHYIKGLYYANIGKDSEAIRSFDSSIISNFTFTDSYIEKAILLSGAGKYDLAIDALTKAMNLDRKNADVYFWLGNCHSGLKDIEKATAFYQEAVRLDPQLNASISSFNNIKKQ